MNAQQNRNANDQRRLALLMRELLARETFESIADLFEAVKMRCAGLRLPWSSDARFTEAYRLLESNRPMPYAAPPRESPIVLSHAEAPAMSAEQAAANRQRLDTMIFAAVKSIASPTRPTRRRRLARR